jgi:hypothetical protein
MKKFLEKQRFEIGQELVVLTQRGNVCDRLHGFPRGTLVTVLDIEDNKFETFCWYQCRSHNHEYIQTIPHYMLATPTSIKGREALGCTVSSSSH